VAGLQVREGRRAVVLARHLLRVVGSTLVYSLRTRRAALALLVLLGILLVGLVTATQVVAPIVIYPFV
jgi:hypothetical protein